MSTLPFPLRAVRAALRRLNIWLSRRYEGSTGSPPVSSPPLDAAEHALRQLDLPGDDARSYFQKHIPRLARTLSLVPPPAKSGQVLELGCYMQLTPFLKTFRGYSGVRGAYGGPAGRVHLKTASVAGERFQCWVDLFNAEADRFPYEDASFETVLACEVIEHLLHDPMHLLLECRRVLEEGGRLILSTPNVASLTSVARALHGYDNPQIHYLYDRPHGDEPPGTPHVREYTAFELGDAVKCAGFEVEKLFTEPIAEFAMNLKMWNFLEENGYNTSLRGEQTYCVAIKRGQLPVTRYPGFLYAE